MTKFIHLLVSNSKSTYHRLLMNALCISVIILMAVTMTACASAFSGKNDSTTNDSTTNASTTNASTTNDSTSSETSAIAVVPVAAKMGIYEKDGKDVVLGGDAPHEVDGAPHEVDGVVYPSIYDAQYSVDQTQAAFLADYTEGQGGALVFASKSQYITIAKNIFSFYLSNDGSTIAYLAGPYDESSGGTLYTYNCAANQSVWVADHAGMTMVLSPKGTSIGYSVISKDASANITVTGCYNADGGVPQQVGENSFVTALTDDADIVYILQSDSTTYSVSALHDGAYTRYSSCPACAGGYTCFIFNRDGTEVILNDDMSTYSYSQNADPSRKIADAMSFGPMGEDISFRRLNVSENAGVHVIYTSAANLSDIMYAGQSSTTYELEIARFDENMKCERKEIEGFIDGSNEALTRFAYVKDNKSLMLLENPFDGGATAMNLSDDVKLGLIYMASDGTLYYLTNANDLYVVRSGNVPVLIKSDVTGMYLLDNDKGSTVFYISDYKEKTSEMKNSLGTKTFQYGRTLYSLDNKEGSTPVALVDYVDSIEGDVYGIVYTAISQITQDKYTCGSTTECYYTRDGKSFEKILGTS